MKIICTLFVLSLSLIINAQSPITAVSTVNSTASSTFTYTNAGNTYNWGVVPNNNVVLLNQLTSGGLNFTYKSSPAGILKLRRVNNPVVSGNATLIWSEAVTSGTTFNMFAAYPTDMETYFNSRAFNKGSDNLMDNVSANANNIERVDYIIASGITTSFPTKVGFAVFDRGATGAHDPFCIAAITSLDVSGNPASYSNIVRVTAANFADPGTAVSYRILKGTAPANILSAGTGSQNRGGVFITLQNLGVTAGTTIYGYSLMANDLPVGATPANLVNFNNATYFPLNTSATNGGIDLVAVTGVYMESSLLPVHFTDFKATENNNKVDVQWAVANEINTNRYEVERSSDAVSFKKINMQLAKNNFAGMNSYSFQDDLSALTTQVVYYRIKQFDTDGSFYYSKTISVRKNKNNTAVSIYPNPVQNHLFVNIKTDQNEKAVINIFNSNGMLVVQQKTTLQKGNNSLSVGAIGILTKGSYMLTITCESGQLITKQIIKQ